MRKYLVVLSLIVFSVSYAQRVKYSELILSFNGMSDEEVKNELKEFMIQDNTEPNPYFRLATIYERTYKKADPLTNYELVMANANEASSRYLQASKYVDAKEVGKNNEYYYPYFPNSFDSKGKPGVEFAVVANKIKNGMDSANLIKQRLPAIYSNFTKSVNSYNQAVKIFAALCAKYSSIEDLYLLYTPDVDAKLTDLKHSYDSTIYYFDQYKTLIKDYPIRYKQNYTIKTIETFRLDGFVTSLNFLSNNVSLWNYGLWVDNVKKATSTRITEIRNKLNDAETKLQASISKLNSNQIADFKPVTLDKELVLELNNVDKESAVLSLLHYQNFQQTWLYDLKSFKVDTAVLERNAVAYSNFIHKSKHADTLITELKDHINDQKIEMHKDFISRFYGNKTALERFVSDEKTFINNSYNDYADKLRKSILTPRDSNQLIWNNKANLVRSGAKVIPLKVQPLKVEELDKGLLITLFNRKNPDGSGYLAGVHKPDKKVNNIVVYVAKVNPDGKVAWLNSFNPNIDSTLKISDANQTLGPVTVTPEGVAFVLHSKHLTADSKMNTFYYLNDKGESRVKFVLADTSFPRFINYRENLNAFVMGLKGSESTSSSLDVKEDMTIMCVNVLRDIMWRKSIAFGGAISSVSDLTDGIVLAGNYTIMSDAKGSEVRTKVNAGECAPFIIKVGDKGEVLPTPIATPFSFYLHRLYRVSDQSINLIGTKGNVQTGLAKSFEYDGPVLHIMITKTGQVIYKSF